MDQADQNRTTARQWQMYASHRQRIERLIVPPRAGQRICILGAGNCNDLDLRWLAEVYDEVHLVDLDAAAVKEAIARQKADSPKLDVHAPFDLTNAAAEIVGGNVERWIELINQPPATPWGRCDVVVSPCVLTQTIVPFRDAAKDRPAEVRKRVRRALVLRHLRLIAASLATGGFGAVVVDLISSEKVKDLARIPAEQVAAAMDRLIRLDKGFPELDPCSMIRACEPIGVKSVQASEPWLWHLGLRKSFIVYALTFRV